MIRTARAALGVVVIGALVGVVPATIAGTAGATTVNCMYSGPIVGHPGMQYICYVVHDDGSRETFYAPGPAVRP
ncbi:hypothetical protein [Nocardia takedensis]|uniref:hypothetical protein n=1 Tax=Nocardia takedensis TaxID=259390 RepID=UPI0002F58B97|nr:hypothetical protein [Nocardia takedensis]